MRRIAAIATLSTIALTSAAVSAGASDPSAGKSAVATVSMGDNFFRPATKQVKPRTTVTWTNDGQNPHTATADNGAFDTGNLTAGKSGSITFNKLGKFPYVCEIHPSMRGKIKVCKKIDGVLTCKKPTG